MVKVRIHPHAAGRMKERGCTRDEVQYTVQHGVQSPAKYGRFRYSNTFAYNRKWQGKAYSRKTIEAYAIDEGAAGWLVVTVIVKFF